MSFDIFFQPCRFSNQTIEKRNPFTGQVETILPSEPLTPAELQAVKAVMARAKAHGPSEHDCCIVELSDGGRAEIYSDDLSTGCMAAIRGMTPNLVQFLYDLLEAGNWVMLPAMEGGGVIATASASLKGVPKNFPRIVACNSGDELGVLLTDGAAAWQQYRSQVAGDEK